MNRRWFVIWLLMGWLLVGSCSEGGGGFIGRRTDARVVEVRAPSLCLGRLNHSVLALPLGFINRRIGTTKQAAQVGVHGSNVGQAQFAPLVDYVTIGVSQGTVGTARDVTLTKVQGQGVISRNFGSDA